MSVLLGSILGVGLVLSASPFLWPGSHDSSPGEMGPLRGGGASGWIRTRLILIGAGPVPPLAFLVLSGMTAFSAAALIHATLSISVLSLLAGVAGGVLPFVLTARRARMKRRIHHTVWPDVVDHLVSAVRSGLALPDSVSTLAHTGPEPTRAAFADFEADYRATGNFSRCTDRLKVRLRDPIADRILETLRMAREVGGNDLTPVLRSLAVYLREEAGIRGEIQARQGWVTNAAKLGVAAPWIVLVMLGSRQEAAQAYNSPSGVLVIAGGALVTFIAYRFMLAIGRLPEDKRFFA